LTTASAAQNCSVHCYHARARGPPLRGQTIDCGMYSTASASLERQGIEDFLQECRGNSGSSAKTLEAKYCCTPSQRRGGAFVAAASPLPSGAVEADGDHPGQRLTSGHRRGFRLAGVHDDGWS
jgi:hypothetical protein